MEYRRSGIYNSHRGMKVYSLDWTFLKRHDHWLTLQEISDALAREFPGYDPKSVHIAVYRVSQSDPSRGNGLMVEVPAKSPE